MRLWFLLLLLGVASLALPSASAQAQRAANPFGVNVERGGRFEDFGGAFARFDFRRFANRFPVGAFEGFCCVALPSEVGSTPTIIVINGSAPPARPPAPPRPSPAELHFTTEKTPQGVTIVRGPAIRP